MVLNINNNSSGSVGDELVVCNGRLFFSANDGNTGFELWQSDGTESGTFLVKNIAFAGVNSYPSAFTVLNNTLFFKAYEYNSGVELRKSDGSEAGTILLKDIYPGSITNPDITNIKAMPNIGKVFFSANLGVGNEFWFSDGTPNGTSSIGQINLNGDSNPKDFTEFNGKAYYTVTQFNTASRRLFSTLGVPGPTNEFVFMQNGGQTGEILNLNVFNGKLIFTADELNAGREIHIMDVNENVIMNNLNGSFSTNPRNFLEYNGSLYFRADNPSIGQELYRLGVNDNITLVDDLTIGSGSSFPLPKVVYNDELILTIDQQGSTGRELWAYKDPSLSNPNFYNEELRVQISPNPTSEFFSVLTNDLITEISLYDIQGKKIMDLDPIKEIYNISSLQSGIYILKINSNYVSSIKKIIKE